MRVRVYVNQSVPKDVRGGPKVERWANGWLIGFRRHFVIVTGRRKARPLDAIRSGP